MIIKNLKIEFSDKTSLNQIKLFSEEINYPFEKITLITSKLENSRGKTTLIRFILYALGYKIPQTDGLKIYSYRTTLEIEEKGIVYILVRQGENQYINGKKFNSTVKDNLNNEEVIPMCASLLKIDSLYLSNALLGCYYIDQEKGWTLLNRGTVIGKIRFNIEKFFASINKKEIDNLFEENTYLEKNIKKINLLSSIIKDDYIYNDDDFEDKKEVLKKLEEIETEELLLKQQIFSKKKEVKKIEDVLFENKKFSDKIEEMNIIVRHKGEDIVVNKNNLKSYDFTMDILEMKKNELLIEIQNLDKLKRKKEQEIKKIREDHKFDNPQKELNRIFGKLKTENLNEVVLNEIKKSNQGVLKVNKEKIISEIKDDISKFWEILEPILKDIGVSEEYIKKEIILTDELAGKSGTLRHKLSLAYKIALVLYVEKELFIKLPFIIDSPMNGEVNKETAQKMLNICRKYLKNNQLLVSSVYNKFNTKFEFESEIILENGVVDELEKFRINPENDK